MREASVMLRVAAAELPAIPSQALQSRGAQGGARFVPVERLSLNGAIIAGTFFSVPALVVLWAVGWMLSEWSMGWLPTGALGGVALGCGLVVVGQIVRLRAAIQAVQRQKARLRGDEGLYAADDWLMLVRNRERISLLPRRAIARVYDVRVRYIKPGNAYCVIHPCAELVDGRRILLRTPPLSGDVYIEDLLAAWQLPTLTRRVDVTARDLDQFVNL